MTSVTQRAAGVKESAGRRHEKMKRKFSRVKLTVGVVLCGFFVTLIGIAAYFPVEVTVVAGAVGVAGATLAGSYVVVRQTQRTKTAVNVQLSRLQAQLERQRDEIKKMGCDLQASEAAERATREREQKRLSLTLTHVLRELQGIEHGHAATKRQYVDA